jgi:hypothetical protein
MIYMKSLFMMLCKVGFVVEQCGSKSELPNNFWCSRMSNYKSNHSTYTPYTLNTHIHRHEKHTDPQTHVSNTAKPALLHINMHTLTCTRWQDTQKRTW